jgi:hypothetical protein
MTTMLLKLLSLNRAQDGLGLPVASRQILRLERIVASPKCSGWR